MSANIMVRGRAVHGVDIGIMMLETDFPRPVGDVANGMTFAFPIHYEIAFGATPPQVVDHAAEGLLDRFVEAGQRLLKRGARALSTSGGLLAVFQDELTKRLNVPIATSSLLQVGMILKVLPTDQTVGLVTINGSSMDERHFNGAGISEQDRNRLVVIGMEDSKHFYPVVVGEDGPLDVERAVEEIVAACVAAIECNPSIRGFVFECTNLPPASNAVREVTGFPVWDSTTLINWLHGGVTGSSGR